ncbi:hypothetical protein [Thalassobaculum salexigens]|uniref:hypothetical protein n=1 Tax=Thalassobaculum salexigens TaxID=455360 RepID=UPI000411DFE4|nr:hypothetical protein [Thalassobaculum salexigens]
MSSVLTELLIGVLLLGGGILALVFTHRFVARATLSDDDYFVPAMAGTLITSLLACGMAFLIEAALSAHMLREIAIAVPVGLVLLVVARALWQRHEARARRVPPAQAMPL